MQLIVVGQLLVVSIGRWHGIVLILIFTSRYSQKGTVKVFKKCNMHLGCMWLNQEKQTIFAKQLCASLSV